MRGLSRCLFSVAMIVTCTLPLTACGLWGLPIRGQVVEAGTGKPLAGAIVIAHWTGSVPAFAESRLVCVHVETATTDAKGRYRLSGWVQGSSVGATALDVGPIVSAYKAGYVQKLHESNKLVKLTPFWGTPGRRLEYLLQVLGNASCGSQNKSEKNLIPLLKALYRETQQLGDVSGKSKVREAILYDLEILELGFEKAEKRHLERVGK